MKPAIRHQLYAGAIVALLLGLWLRPAPEAPASVVAASPRVERLARSSVAAVPQVQRFGKRNGQMPLDLFSSPELPPPAVVQAVAPTPIGPPPIPEINLLGWVLADQIPWVSVMVGNEGFTLRPGDEADALYRYDGVKDGMAAFTYIPNGTHRLYPLSDVQISE